MATNQPTQELYDIYNLMYVPFWQTQIFRFSLVITVFVMAITAGVLYWRRRRGGVVSPWDAALENLNRLEPDHERAHLFYQKLTSDMKIYLEHRYSSVLSSKTDEELVELEMVSSLPDHLQPQLQELFRRAINYKFGKIGTTLEQMREDKEFAVSFVRQTIPKEPRKQD